MLRDEIAAIICDPDMYESDKINAIMKLRVNPGTYEDGSQVWMSLSELEGNDGR